MVAKAMERKLNFKRIVIPKNKCSNDKNGTNSSLMALYQN